jgi:hypothetical protein
LGHLAVEFPTKMKTTKPTIRPDAIRWFFSKYGTKSNAMYASKFYRREESWKRQLTWSFEIPKRTIETPKSAEIDLICEVAPNAKDFYHLKVPVKFLKSELPNLYVLKDGNVGLFLSAEQREMFAEIRGNGKVGFGRFLFVPARLACKTAT